MEQLLDRIAKASTAVKLGGAAAIIVLMTVLNFLFLVQPVEEQIERSEGELRALERQYVEKKEIADNLNERRREMAQLEEKLAQALTELPEQAELQDLLGQLNDISRKSGLELARVEPGAEIPAEFFSRIPLRMNVRGNYHEIAMFMQEIARMRRIVNVNNIKLSEAGLRNEKVILNAEFLATTFRFLEPKPGATPKPGGG